MPKILKNPEIARNSPKCPEMFGAPRGGQFRSWLPRWVSPGCPIPVLALPDQNYLENTAARASRQLPDTRKTLKSVVRSSKFKVLTDFRKSSRRWLPSPRRTPKRSPETPPRAPQDTPDRPKIDPRSTKDRPKIDPSRGDRPLRTTTSTEKASGVDF